MRICAKSTGRSSDVHTVACACGFVCFHPGNQETNQISLSVCRGTHEKILERRAAFTFLHFTIHTQRDIIMQAILPRPQSNTRTTEQDDKVIHGRQNRTTEQDESRTRAGRQSRTTEQNGTCVGCKDEKFPQPFGVPT